MDKLAKEMLHLLKRIAKQGVIYGIGDVTSGMIVFLLIPIYTRYLTPADYGMLAILITFISLINVLISLGVRSSLFICYFNEQRQNERRLYVSTAFSLVMLSSLSFSLLIVLLSRPFSILLLKTPVYSTYFYFVAIIVFFESVFSIPLAVFRVEEAPIKYVSVLLSKLILCTLLNIYFVVVVQKGILGILYGYSIAGAMFWFITSLLVVIRYRVAFRYAYAKELLRLGLPLMSAVLLNWIVVLSDRYILNIYRPMQEVGLYDLGYTLAKAMNILLVAPFAKLWAVMMFRVYKKEDSEKIFSRFFTYFFCCASIVALVLSVFAKELISVISPPEYSGSSKVVPIIILSYLLYGLYYFWTFGPAVKKRTKEYIIVTGYAAITNLVLNFALIPRFGMIGAATATILAYFVMAVSMLHYSNRFCFVRYEWTRVFKVSLICLCLLLIKNIVDVSTLVLQCIVNVSIISIVPILLFAVRFYTAGEKKYLRDYCRHLIRKLARNRLVL